MAAALSLIVAKDGAGSTVSGGLQYLDLSGSSTGPWVQTNVIVDGTAGLNRAAVKAASTAPVATDPALVVAISPNSVNANGQATMANSAPVVIASNQSAVPVTVPLGSQASAASTPVVIATDQVAVSIKTPAGGGQQTTANSISASIPSDASASVATSFTRPSTTTGYNANAIIGVSTGTTTSAFNFASMGLNGSRIMITSAQLEIDSTAAIPTNMTNFNLYLYNITPPSSSIDATVLGISTGDRASFLGKINLGTPILDGSTQYCELTGINKQLKLSGTGLFAYLVTATSFTPAASIQYTTTLHAIQL